MKTKNKQMGEKTLIAWLFLLPFVLLYSVFVIWPVLSGVYISFHKWGLMGKIRFVGINNYIRFLEDKNFWAALGHTTQFVLMSVPLLIITALVLALLANRRVFCQKFLRVSYYIPNVLSVAVISFLFKFMFSPYTGFISTFLHSLGILAPDQEIQWLKDVNFAWLVITFATVWWTTGFTMMLYISALQDIPSQIYEAAEIDGASKSRQLFSITLPLLKPATYLVLLLQVIASFKVFGQVLLITGGGPGGLTRPLIQYIYDAAFRQNDMGYGAAMSYALFLILVVLSYIQTKIQKNEEAKA